MIIITAKNTCKVEINKHNLTLLTQILSFFSWNDIHTFSSFSNDFYDLANECGCKNLYVDAMVKILANNQDATCLSATNQELLFYKPFLALPQTKCIENQNYSYNQGQIMTTTIMNVQSQNELHLDNNQIESKFVNFMAIQKHSNLESLELQDNKISSLHLNAFQGAYLENIKISGNKLGIELIIFRF